MRQGQPYFSGNYGSALGSTANAANLIARAGEVQGQMFANIGKQIGSTLEKFRMNKEKKETEQRAENLFLKQYESNPDHPIFKNFNINGIDEAKAVAKDLSKDPALVKSAMELGQMAQQQEQMALINGLRRMQMGATAQGMAQNAQAMDQAKKQQTGQNQFSNFQLQAPQNESPEAFRRRVQTARDSGNLNQQGANLAANSLMQKESATSDRNFELQKIQAEAIAKGPQLTEGEKALDREFAKEMVSFNLPDINKGLAQLTEAAKALGGSETLTGPWVSMLPNFVGDRVNPKATEVREAVEEVVQRNLRLVLGAQFTEKEGERLISRAYNPKLDEAENKKRVERLITSIRDAAQEKLNMRAHFSKYGTLRGYNFDGPTVESIEQTAFGDIQKPEGEDPDLLEEEARLKQLLIEREGLFSTPPAQVMDVPGAR